MAVTWLTMIGLVLAPLFCVTGMMNDPAIENTMSPDADSWGIPLFGDAIVGIVLAAVVYGLMKHFTHRYSRPGLFAWR